MTIRTIDVGEEPNDETGDTLRDGGIIINENFAELDTRTAAAQAKADQGVTDAAAAQAKADQGVADAASAQAKADKGVADAAKAQDAAAAAKAVADAALPGAALGVTVAQLVSGKVPVLQLPEFVEPVKGKGLSSNDYTTPEKTKLADMVNPLSFGLGSKSLNLGSDDVTSFSGYASNTAGFPGGNGQAITMVGASTRRTRIATDHDVDAVYYQRMTDTWQPWRRFLLRNDYGLGSDPRSGLAVDQIGFIPDISATRPNGKFRVSPATAGGPGIFGTLEMSWYDATNWTMTVNATDASVIAVRGCVNGTMTGWAFHYPGKPALTRMYESPQLTFTNGQLQGISHGFGSFPKLVQLVIVPVIDQASWTAGLNVQPVSGFSIGAGIGEIFVKVAPSGLTILDAQSGNVSNLIPANWRIVVRAFI
ncbi:hypothetical protein [Pseudomonas protegens]|uniref:hypothetical protein n=1 Tax=Pseudomonas protegens TaxID=380021 RepID=UPI0024C39E3F|nr:hypothetical protein [Pseudomonas protegens]MDK1397926.1 hypothetical protein [Pseudomonas protegens]